MGVQRVGSVNPNCIVQKLFWDVDSIGTDVKSGIEQQLNHCIYYFLSSRYIFFQE